MAKPFIPVVLGTAREGRNSEKAARYFLELFQADDRIETQLVDVRDHLHSQTIAPWQNNLATKPWRDIASRSQAFFFVVPEYNHGYPGEFKMLIDQDFDAYKGKRAVVCGVSKGPFGGARMVENVLPVLNYVGLRPLAEALYVMNVEKTFAQTKEELDKQYVERVKKTIGLLLE